MPVIVGTDSCSPGHGYTLRPGTYGVVVPLELVGEEDSAGRRRRDVILSPEIRLALR